MAAMPELPSTFDARDAECLQAQLVDQSLEVGLPLCNALEPDPDQAASTEHDTHGHRELLVVDPQHSTIDDTL